MTSLQKTNSGKRPGQRRGDEFNTTNKNIGAKKWKRKVFKPTSAPYFHKKEPPSVDAAHHYVVWRIYRRHQSDYYFVLPTHGPIENRKNSLDRCI